MRLENRDLRLLLDLLAATTGLAPPLKSVLTPFTPYFLQLDIFLKQGDVLAGPKICGPVQTSDPQPGAAARYHQWFAFSNIAITICGVRDNSRRRWHDDDVLRVQLGEEHLQQDDRDQRHLYGSDTSSYWQGNYHVVISATVWSYHPSQMLVFSGFSGSSGFWRGPWENHCNCDELLSQQVL